MVVTNIETRPHTASPGERMQVMVNVRADVVDPEIARRNANRWLLDNAGNLLAARTPELLLGEHLQWRFDVVLTRPELERPGRASQQRIGQIAVDAATGEVQVTSGFAEELQHNAATLAS
jgi:hypothetical protein